MVCWIQFRRESIMKQQDIIIDSQNGIEKVIDTLNQFARSGKYVFRGYGKQSEILPNIIRKGNYVNIESELLHAFEKYGSNYFHANTPIDFMSYAQHFGLSTRLLAFTYNPFIALFFALYVDKGNGIYKEIEDKTYYYIRFASIQDNLLITSLPQSTEYIEKDIQTSSLATQSMHACHIIDEKFGDQTMLSQKALDTIYSCFNSSSGINDRLIVDKKIQEKRILFIDPNHSNQRIIMQQGLFMFPYTLDKMEHLQILKNNSAVIKIHKDLRDGLIQYLDTLGYNTFRLMPDLSSICSAVERRIIDERKHKS